MGVGKAGDCSPSPTCWQVMLRLFLKPKNQINIVAPIRFPGLPRRFTQYPKEMSPGKQEAFEELKGMNAVIIRI